MIKQNENKNRLNVISSSAMEERPRDAILRGWVTLRLNFRLKGYVSRQYLWTVRSGNGYTTICRGKFSHKETLQQTLFEWNWILFKNQKIDFWATLWGPRGNVRSPCIARWKASGRLPIYLFIYLLWHRTISTHKIIHIIELFPLSLTVETL